MKESFVYRCLSYIWRNTVLRWYYGYKQRKQEVYWEEHTRSFGKEHPDKTFYVIRRRDLYCGLFSLFLTSLQRIDDAVKKGYIPVIDMQNDFNIYLSEDKIGRENAWEYYFKQPMGYSLEDIRNSKNVIIGSGAVPQMFPYLDIKFLMGETGELEYWRKCASNYISLSDDARRIVDREYNRLFVRGDKVLGVICRGTDYTKQKPRNHPVQPTPEQAAEKAEELYLEHNCTKVFLATEDADVYDIFKRKFAEKLVVEQTEHISYQGGAIGKELYEQKDSKEQMGMKYLSSIMLIAKCDCLCAGCVSATVAALLLAGQGGYEAVYLFDLGLYG